MSAQNFLRALLNGYGSGKKREELQKLLKAFPVHESDGSYLLDEGNFRGYGRKAYFERGENKPNRRNYYGECAAYIAALGEVRESVGEMGAKQKLMTSYKEKYPRRSAFREEMRQYGWIDTKRK